MRHLNILFVVATFMGMAISMFALSRKPSLQRRLFWTGVALAAISAFFIAYPPDVKMGFQLSLFVGSLWVTWAYFGTSYIKIGGKIYAFLIFNSRAEQDPDGVGPESGDPEYDPARDSYFGLTTPGNLWALLTLGVGLVPLIVVMTVIKRDGLQPAVVAAATVMVLALLCGYGDAVWEYPIARGQLVQFVIIGIITAGVFTVFYLGAYFAGKRWPWRNKRSMEYRAHPRHQKKWP